MDYGLDEPLPAYTDELSALFQQGNFSSGEAMKHFHWKVWPSEISFRDY